MLSKLVTFGDYCDFLLVILTTDTMSPRILNVLPISRDVPYEVLALILL